MTLLPEVDGPHRLPQGEQERCAVEGRRIDGSGLCNVVAIRDRKHRGWVLYPHGVAGFGGADRRSRRPHPRRAPRRPIMTPAGEDDDMIDKGGDKHRDKEQEKRDTDGQRPIDPDTVREPKPGKRGK
ncbi:MAG: hypothetical protein ACRDTH_06490 [Pseudonocardiaceae bacterium]